MIVYEVNLHIDAIAADEYAEWLGPHIEQILDIEGFQKADWFVLCIRPLTPAFLA